VATKLKGAISRLRLTSRARDQYNQTQQDQGHRLSYNSFVDYSKPSSWSLGCEFTKELFVNFITLIMFSQETLS
jgi:hypothetical protein